VIKIESQVYIDIGRINPSGMADRIAGPDRNGYYALSYDKKAITLSLATDRAVPPPTSFARPITCSSAFLLPPPPSSASPMNASARCSLTSSWSLSRSSANRPRTFVMDRMGPMACCFVVMPSSTRRALSGGPPRKTGGTWPDYRHRNRIGEGQWIDASKEETVIGLMPKWYTGLHDQWARSTQAPQS
jgi:hypothetical protein